MKAHIDKALNNERFLQFIESNIKDDFIDWKITVIFYAALHYLKAFLKFKKVPNVNSHKEIDNAINPGLEGAKYPIPKNEFETYRDLYQISRSVRYSGIYKSDLQVLLLSQSCEKSKQNLEVLKAFFVAEGLILSQKH